MKKSLLKLFKTKPLKLSKTKLKKIESVSKKIKELSKLPTFDKEMNRLYNKFI